MDNTTTSEFVEKIHEQQKKQEENKQRGKGHPSKRLPNKRHSQGE